MRKGAKYYNELVKEFKEHVRNQIPSGYPILTENELHDLCKYQFLMLRLEMENGTMNPVRVKRIGIFKPYPSKAMGLKNRAVRLLSEGRLSRQQADDVIKIANLILEHHESGQTSDDD